MTCTQTQRDFRHNDEAQAQRALLADPVAFGAAMYDRIAGGCFDRILIQNVPDGVDAVDEALLALLTDAARVGDLAMVRQALAYLPDTFTNGEGTAQTVGIRLGAVFERLRRDLVDCVAMMDSQELDPFYAGHAEHIARMRATMAAATT